MEEDGKNRGTPSFQPHLHHMSYPVQSMSPVFAFITTLLRE